MVLLRPASQILLRRPEARTFRMSRTPSAPPMRPSLRSDPRRRWGTPRGGGVMVMAMPVMVVLMIRPRLVVSAGRVD